MPFFLVILAWTSRLHVILSILQQALEKLYLILKEVYSCLEESKSEVFLGETLDRALSSTQMEVGEENQIQDRHSVVSRMKTFLESDILAQPPPAVASSGEEDEDDEVKVRKWEDKILIASAFVEADTAQEEDRQAENKQSAAVGIAESAARKEETKSESQLKVEGLQRKMRTSTSQKNKRRKEQATTQPMDEIDDIFGF